MNWTEKAEQALNHLADTDQQIAALKTKHERDKRKAKRTWSSIYLRAEGSVEARKAYAETHEEYQRAIAAEMTSLLQFEQLRNQRDTDALIIDFWRSYQRAVREGDVS